MTTICERPEQVIGVTREDDGNRTRIVITAKQPKGVNPYGDLVTGRLTLNDDEAMALVSLLLGLVPRTASGDACTA